MDISSDVSGALQNANLSNEVSVRVAKISQNAAKAEGDAALKLLATAAKISEASQGAPGSIDVTG